MATNHMRSLLALRFGPEWTALSEQDQRNVLADFAAMLREEYDTPDDTMSDGIGFENAHFASREYRHNIGGGNLKAYAEVLQAGINRRKAGA